MRAPFGSHFSQAVKNPLGRAYLQAFGWPNISTRVRANTVLPLLDAKRGEKILDAGCGFGLYSLALAKKGINSVGVDIDEEQVIAAKELAGKLKVPNVRFEAHDICNLPHEYKSFDKVLCVDVIEHIPDDEKAISELARVLKVGGILALTTPTPVSSQICFFHKDAAEAVGHVREGYTNEKLRGILERNGLLITEHRYYNRFFERFASEINTTLLRSVGGSKELKKASEVGSLSNITNLLPVLLTFPPLFSMAKVDSIISPTIEKNCIAVRAKKLKASNTDR
ncbi:MAG: class I SAM-dependent methyltransferase [Candidatus Bathyarchaeota archaeon]|nr:MAG: class I SAM-dependent methyltransferase [Candidatus Bathyarchaeota archaeon]